jgi:hypothetical protein
MKRYGLCFLGFGNVGHALARLLVASRQSYVKTVILNRRLPALPHGEWDSATLSASRLRLVPVLSLSGPLPFTVCSLQIRTPKKEAQIRNNAPEILTRKIDFPT